MLYIYIYNIYIIYIYSSNGILYSNESEEPTAIHDTKMDLTENVELKEPDMHTQWSCLCKGQTQSQITS